MLMLSLVIRGLLLLLLLLLVEYAGGANPVGDLGDFVGVILRNDRCLLICVCLEHEVRAVRHSTEVGVVISTTTASFGCQVLHEG